MRSGSQLQKHLTASSEPYNGAQGRQRKETSSPAASIDDDAISFISDNGKQADASLEYSDFSSASAPSWASQPSQSRDNCSVGLDRNEVRGATLGMPLVLETLPEAAETEAQEAAGATKAAADDKARGRGPAPLGGSGGGVDSITQEIYNRHTNGAAALPSKAKTAAQPDGAASASATGVAAAATQNGAAERRRPEASAQSPSAEVQAPAQREEPQSVRGLSAWFFTLPCCQAGHGASTTDAPFAESSRSTHSNQEESVPRAVHLGGHRAQVMPHLNKRNEAKHGSQPD